MSGKEDWSKIEKIIKAMEDRDALLHNVGRLPVGQNNVKAPRSKNQNQNGNKAATAMVQPRLKVQNEAMPESASSSILSNCLNTFYWRPVRSS
jgi:hypothetical protein